MAPEVHLPEAFLRMYVPLRHEHIVGRRSVDVRDSHVVPYDLDCGVETDDGHLTINIGECTRHGDPHEQSGSYDDDQEDRGYDTEQDLPPRPRPLLPVARRFCVTHVAEGTASTPAVSS